MDLITAGSLALLALIDSTSFGTLLVPIILLMIPGPVRVGRILAYLATVTTCYFGLGLALVSGGRALGGQLTALLDSPLLVWAQLVVGVALVVISFRIDTVRARQRTDERIARWRERATGGVDGSGSLLPLMGLALGAVAVEAASMLPYLGAIGLLASSPLPGLGVVAALLGYCVVMIAPALVLLVARVLAQARVEPLLGRINDWFVRHAAGATSWIVGIVGFLVARDALARGGLLTEVLARFGVEIG